MSSDGYNHFLVNPNALVVGGPPASTPAAAPESAIQRLLGGAPELLDRISEQAAEMSFKDPLNIYFRHMHKLYDHHDELSDPRCMNSNPAWRLKQFSGRRAYRCMLGNIDDKLHAFGSNVIDETILSAGNIRENVVETIPNAENIYEDVGDLRGIINRIIHGNLENSHVRFVHFKSYNHLYDQWKALRAQMAGLLEDNRMSDLRITGNWIIKNIDDTFTSMRELLLSMAPAKGQENPRAPFTQKYMGKRNLTERILKGRPAEKLI